MVRKQQRELSLPLGSYVWAACLLLIVLIPVRATARTLVVGRDGAYGSIREAVAAASAGDVVEVHPGVYEGNLLVDRSLILIGVGDPIIRGSGSGSVLTITADRCVVRGFAIEHSGGMLVDEDSGILLKSSGNSIERNQLRDVLYGIYLLAANDNQIVGNIIRGRPLPDLGSRGSGIHVWNSRNNLLADNTITTSRDGMYLQNAYHSLIRNNRIYDLRYGLHYMFSDDNTFEGNLSYNNVAGAAIMYSKRIQFRHNVFVHNRGFSSFGILFQDTEHCLAEDNIISDNAVGIFMEALRNSTLRHNVISANDIALQIFQSASNNVFEANNFVENLSPIEVIGGLTSTRWNGAQGGNYWSDYDGHDLDANGIGDIPFRIENVFQHLEGAYPRLRIYLYSPASQALALAEKGFPVLQRKQETDELPLMRPAALKVEGPEISALRKRNTVALLFPGLLLIASAVLFRWGARR